MNMIDLRSPFYRKAYNEWEKFRDIIESGTYFRDKYLQQYALRESTDEFAVRRGMSYVPSVARACLMKYKNSIYQRMADITRTDGEVTYQEAIAGNDLTGVDGTGRSMNQFIGQRVLFELISMGKVGIFVDREMYNSEKVSQRDIKNIRPYLYTYAVEDILNMKYENNKLVKLLLRRNDHKYDTELGLYVDDEVEYIYFERFDFGISYKIYAEDCEGIYDYKAEGILELTEIPFVLLEIEASLLKDISDFEIALLNIESGDVNFCWKANFPFYTEQQELQAGDFAKLNVTMDDDGNPTQTATNTSQTVAVGLQNGRIYSPGLDRPGFINPASEPLRASMDKQKQMRESIEYIIGLNVQSLASSSAENKKSDMLLKEEGLSAIGLELERAERKIAKLWSEYMGSDDVAQIDYPNNYSLRTDDDRRKEAEEIIEDAKKIPSKTYHKEAAKRAARLLMTQGISKDTWTRIDSEIESSPVIFADPKDIQRDKELGIVSTETAAKARHYPDGEAIKAKADKIEQLTQIALAQSSAANDSRINVEARYGGGESAKDEKTLSQDDLFSADGRKVRGEEK